jgi:IBR domain, a half RING-finger domain
MKQVTSSQEPSSPSKDRSQCLGIRVKRVPFFRRFRSHKTTNPSTVADVPTPPHPLKYENNAGEMRSTHVKSRFRSAGMQARSEQQRLSRTSLSRELAEEQIDAPRPGTRISSTVFADETEVEAVVPERELSTTEREGAEHEDAPPSFELCHETIAYHLDQPEKVASETQECSVCTETLPLHAFPGVSITSTCISDFHRVADGNLICKACINSSILAQLETSRPLQITCPLCHEQIAHQEIKNWTTQEIFERYDHMITLEAIQQEGTFIRCCIPECPGGQFHDGDAHSPIAKCQTCGTMTCYRHSGLPWHEGLTCEDFEDASKAVTLLQDYIKDLELSARTAGITISAEQAEAENDEFEFRSKIRVAQRLLSERQVRLASESDERGARAVAELTKPCPGCRAPVQKIGGCKEVKCRCGYRFCYGCLIPWERAHLGTFCSKEYDHPDIGRRVAPFTQPHITPAEGHPFRLLQNAQLHAPPRMSSRGTPDPQALQDGRGREWFAGGPARRRPRARAYYIPSPAGLLQPLTGLQVESVVDQTPFRSAVRNSSLPPLRAVTDGTATAPRSFHDVLRSDPGARGEFTVAMEAALLEAGYRRWNAAVPRFVPRQHNDTSETVVEDGITVSRETHMRYLARRYVLEGGAAGLGAIGILRFADQDFAMRYLGLQRPFDPDFARAALPGLNGGIGSGGLRGFGAQQDERTPPRVFR